MRTISYRLYSLSRTLQKEITEQIIVNKSSVLVFAYLQKKQTTMQKQAAATGICDFGMNYVELSDRPGAGNMQSLFR